MIHDSLFGETEIPPFISETITPLGIDILDEESTIELVLPPSFIIDQHPQLQTNPQKFQALRKFFLLDLGKYIFKI
ncbi:hypothetical protein CYK03_20485 [Pseudomonas aeruginosa]|nr:hypothetical protein CYK03_20485 [Pseudomonas aeruginosa]